MLNIESCTGIDINNKIRKLCIYVKLLIIAMIDFYIRDAFKVECNYKQGRLHRLEINYQSKNYDI